MDHPRQSGHDRAHRHRRGREQHSYLNGKIGVRSTSDTDSLRIAGMGMVYLERGVVLTGVDALQLNGIFIAECGGCVELVNSGQASMVNDNHLGAGPAGFSLLAEGHFGLIVSGNDVFPRGKSSVHLKNCADCTVSANRLHSFSSGLVPLEGICRDNLIAANHFLRNRESFGPFQSVPLTTDDPYGLVHINGSGNTVTGNHFTYDVLHRHHPLGGGADPRPGEVGERQLSGDQPPRRECGRPIGRARCQHDEHEGARLRDGRRVRDARRGNLRIPRDAVVFRRDPRDLPDPSRGGVMASIIPAAQRSLRASSRAVNRCDGFR
ncbi:hypothetical protein GCM10029992_11590 [Glycomyces albus]